MEQWKFLHKIFLAVGIIVGLWVIYVVIGFDRMARIGAGYKAKIACSEIFVAGRAPETVLNHEFSNIASTMDTIQVTVDLKGASVRAHGPFGLGGVRAFYRPKFGCTLASGGRIAPLPELRGADGNGAITPTDWEQAPPVSGQAITRIDYAALDFALTRAFNENTASHRAVLVVVDGKIVDERYGDGFSKETPFLSWSMAKSLTATLVGAAVQQGLVEISNPVSLAAWAGDGSKASITWDDLLRMQSGLAFEEGYRSASADANRMFFEQSDAGSFAARMEMDHAPGEVWSYSSGTTNIIIKALSERLAKDGEDLQSFARTYLFGPLGASSMVLEPDASGNFVGSSFAYATVRDWARLGQLYLYNGNWNGMRLLPETWAAYVSDVTQASDGEYGAHFWLNHDGTDGRERVLPGLPPEVYYFSGYEGQYVFIIPDKNMVIVRTGLTRDRPPLEAVAPLAKSIYDAVGNPAKDKGY